jgi:hypothetical protein
MANQGTLTGELGRIADSIAKGEGGKRSPLSSGSSYEVAAAAGPYEEVLIRHSVGTGTVRIRPDGVYIIVTGRMYTLEGVEDGTYEAVFKAGFTKIPEDLTDYPQKPNDIYDQPTELEEVRHLARTKARWKFKDGSSCEGPGPAPSYIAPLKNGNVQFWVSASAVVVAGTGNYDGVIGQETSLGSTWFPAQPSLQDGEQFEAKVLHCFKLIRKEYRAEYAQRGVR